MRWTVKEHNLYDWHPCFAWWPVKLVSGETAWLETVERRREIVTSVGISTWQYRSVPNHSPVDFISPPESQWDAPEPPTLEDRVEINQPTCKQLLAVIEEAGLQIRLSDSGVTWTWKTEECPTFVDDTAATQTFINCKAATAPFTVCGTAVTYPNHTQSQLDLLLERARNWVPTEEDLFQQRVSWIYGMQDFDDPNPMTKECIEKMLRDRKF